MLPVAAAPAVSLDTAIPATPAAVSLTVN
jgi:hypothetical protein